MDQTEVISGKAAFRIFKTCAWEGGEGLFFLVTTLGAGNLLALRMIVGIEWHFYLRTWLTTRPWKAPLRKSRKIIHKLGYMLSHCAQAIQKDKKYLWQINRDYFSHSIGSTLETTSRPLVKKLENRYSKFLDWAMLYLLPFLFQAPERRRKDNRSQIDNAIFWKLFNEWQIRKSLMTGLWYSDKFPANYLVCNVQISSTPKWGS